MQITTFLAMTAGEISASSELPEHPAFMACHFSPYSTGLSNCPAFLPPGVLLMVNDRIPIWHHDSGRILSQLQQLREFCSPGGIVLDFQRPGFPETRQLTRVLVRELDCPVIVSEAYGAELDCPVFLSAPPLFTPLARYLRPWEGREIWLEAALEGQALTLTRDGCTRCTQPVEEPLPFENHALHCRYGFSVGQEEAVFTLARFRPELDALLEEAASLGIRNAIGLYQQLHRA